jgi:hypothetical protein
MDEVHKTITTQFNSTVRIYERPTPGLQTRGPHRFTRIPETVTIPRQSRREQDSSSSRRRVLTGRTADKKPPLFPF